ncbi:MAG: hypothetical protein ACKO58_05095, partial [Cyanobium sp.]
MLQATCRGGVLLGASPARKAFPDATPLLIAARAAYGDSYAMAVGSASQRGYALLTGLGATATPSCDAPQMAALVNGAVPDRSLLATIVSCRRRIAPTAACLGPSTASASPGCPNGPAPASSSRSMPGDLEDAEAAGRECKEGMPGSGSDRAWWRPPSWSRSPLLHEWIRSGTVLIAAAWGVYTFIYKDILVPSWQPAHLTLEANLSPVPDRPAKAAGLDMMLQVKATNASSRRVYLLANIWTLRGVDTAPRTGSKVDSEFLQESIQSLRYGSLLHTERGVRRSAGKMLAVGRLLGDEFIDPGSSVNRS